MWSIYLMAAVGLSVMGVILYGWLYNRHVDKYNEWLKEHGDEQGEATQV